MTDTIPIVETYRGVGVHADQPRERIERRVKPEIDAVFAMQDSARLFIYCGDVTRPPEARMLAGAMLEAMFAVAVEERRERPNINLELVRARTAGLNSLTWRDSRNYCSLLDARGAPGAPKPERREQPLPEKRYQSRAGVNATSGDILDEDGDFDLDAGR